MTLGSIIFRIVAAGLACAPCAALAANIVAGNVGTVLGPDFIVNDASTGGDDHTAVNFARDLTAVFQPGAAVTLTGLAWASSASGTSATTATATFTDSGPDGAFGTPDDVVVGTVSDALTFSGANTYVWKFDTPVVFTSAAGTLRIAISANGNVRRKTTSGNATTAGVKLSLAGTATGGTPPPVTHTASGSGFWDTITWNSGSGTTTGGVNDADTALIGRYRQVTFRGVPASESIAALDLGESAANPGQGTLILTSGTLNIAGNLTAGRNTSANDSFIHVNGGTLQVGGNASFGRGAEGCDGSLIVAGGTVRITGDLAMGGSATGGAMLRFHNPGGSPAVEVGGTLVLDRCSLDLTFDAGYTHIPGTVTTLITHGMRDGQFLNARRGEEISRGPNRFRIDYNAGPSGNAITLTALPNWTTRETPPNVVLIFTDDQGYADLQPNGHPTWAARFPMPRLQALANAGARFTDAYVSGGVCHPSRVGLLTGRYQQRLGSDNNLGSASADGMAAAQTTVPDRLRSIGYRTYGIGKWHLGETVEYHPNVRGFDRWNGMWGGSRSYYNATAENTIFQNQMTPVFGDEDNTYLTDRIGDLAVEFIDEHLAAAPARPFFMYVSFTAVHGPNDLQFLDGRFSRLESEYGLTQADYTETPTVYNGDKAKTELERYRLAGMTLALDDNIGKIVDKVAAAGLAENTIFVYLNDNGGPGWATGSGGNWSYNSPLRGLKGGSMTDGSIRVPCVMTWPGTIPPGQVVSTPVISLDFMATFVNAGGAPAQVRNGLDGLDLLPLLRDGTPLPPERALTWRASGTASGGSAIRIGDWKLLINDPNQSAALYNIAANPGESNNLAASEPGRAADLKRRFDAWESSTIAPLYGPGASVADSGLDRQAIAGGHRLKRRAATLGWLSSTFRRPIPLDEGFHFRFLARPAESTHGPAAKLAYALGDSEARGGWIRAVIDLGAGQIRLEDGKAGTSATAALPPLSADFTEASLDYAPTSRTLGFAYGGATVSLALSAAHGPLTHHASGVAATEGELTTLVPSDGRPMAASAKVDLAKSPDGVDLTLRIPFTPPFDPVLYRSPELAGFAKDDSVLIENLGGGLYRATAIADPAAGSEFFRFDLSKPSPTHPNPENP